VELVEVSNEFLQLCFRAAPELDHIVDEAFIEILKDVHHMVRTILKCVVFKISHEEIRIDGPYSRAHGNTPCLQKELLVEFEQIFG